MKTRMLMVGDPHATISNLDELATLCKWIDMTALKNEVDYIVFFGDLFHNHAVIRLEVLEAWYYIIKNLSDAANIIIMEGNHDQPGSKELEGSMSAVRSLGRMFAQDSRVIVTHSPTIIDDVGFLPYTYDEKTFYQWAKGWPQIKTLCCHQTFQGSKFDSGMYAPDGFDPEKVPQQAIISGHIHMQQEFGKVHYIGTPKWESAVDAERDKGIWIMDFDGGVMRSREFISTADVVTPMRKLILKEGDPEPELLKGSKYLIEMIGSSAWITKTRKKYLGLASLKSTCTDLKTRNKRSGKGFSSIKDFLDKDFQPSQGVDREELIKYLLKAG